MGSRTRYRKRKSQNYVQCMGGWVGADSLGLKLFHQLPSDMVSAGDATPAPSSYTLPTMLGDRVPHRSSSAAYSMLGRPKVGGFSDDNKHTPAPNMYEVANPDTTQKKQPSYTMRSRVYMPGGWCVCAHTHTHTHTLLQAKTVTFKWLCQSILPECGNRINFPVWGCDFLEHHHQIGVDCLPLPAPQ